MSLEDKFQELERLRSSLRDDLGLLPDDAKQEMQHKQAMHPAPPSFANRVVATALMVVLQLGVVYYLSSQVPVIATLFGMRQSPVFRAYSFLGFAALAAFSSFVGIPLEIASIAFTWKAIDAGWVGSLDEEYRMVVFAASIAAGCVVAFRKLRPRKGKRKQQ